MNNPLLSKNELPPFGAILPEHIVPAVDELLSECSSQVDKLTSELDNPTWDKFVGVLEAIDDRLSQAWSPVSHMKSVVNSDELREAYNECLPKLSEYSTKMGQNKDLYELYKSFSESGEFSSLSQPQKRAVENALRDFRLSGIALDEAGKKRYGELKKRLSELTTKFSENVLDATQGWTKHVTDVATLAGLPESSLEGCAAAAKAKELEGYLITLEIPSYLPVMTYGENRELRKELYEAYATRASDRGPNAGQWDNSQLMKDILAVRQSLAKLLGMNNYAERSLATKMAQTPEQVLGFLEDLAAKSIKQARHEYTELEAFASEQLGIEKLEAWDMHFASEKLKLAKYNISQEELRPYFPVDRVVQGMFQVVKKLYDIDVEEIKEFDSWHPDVRHFAIKRGGEVIAKFYIDIFARENKRGGAWMDECRVRRITENGIQLPVAYLVCNFTPPVGDSPSLLTHNEVTTLFHEFGHGLHHMLTQVAYSDVSGINGVAWDAVELPSQFMENWCWQEEALDIISGHFETGAPLPTTLLEKMLAAKNFQSGMFMVRQLEFSLFDFRLHMAYREELDTNIQQILDQVRNQVAVVKPPEFNRFQHSFSHIFAGGYAAGYYSYKWAEVLSSDAFSLFEEKGIFDKETGQKFLSEILEMGGSEDPMTLFVNFRGREPSVDALLRHCGIAS